MATFWKRASYLVNPYVLFAICILFILVVSHFAFNCGSAVVIAPVPGHCLPFTLGTSLHPRLFVLRLIIDPVVQCPELKCFLKV